MSYIDDRLAEIKELQRTVKEEAAEQKMRELLGLMKRYEVVEAEGKLRSVIDRFLKKRQKRLMQVLVDAKAGRASTASPPSSPAPPADLLLPLAGSSTQTSVDRELSLRQLELVFSQASSAKDPAAQRDMLRRFAFAALGLAKVSVAVSDDPTKRLFDVTNSVDAKRVILACLARLIGVVNWVGDDLALRVETTKLFDELWRHEVYAKLEIDKSSHGFEKWQKLESAAPAIEHQISDAVNGLQSLTGLTAVRRELMRALNSALSRAVFWPFVQRELVSIRLEELFNLVGDYESATGSELLPALHRATEALDRFVASTADDASSYARLLGSFASRLHGLVDQHFFASPFSKPAEVSLTATIRRYPLGITGAECRVAVAVACSGPGHAFDVEIEFEVSDNLQPLENHEYLGNLEPNRIVEDVLLQCKVIEPSQSATVSGELRWVNHDKTMHKKDFSIQLESQPADIAWDELETQDPYSLEPVIEEAELVGRTELTNQLVAKLSARSVGSFIVFGQKRVGKTSLVRTLGSRLDTRAGGPIHVVYLEGGDYVHKDAQRTVMQLGQRICEEIRDSDPRLAQIAIPDFDGALSPLDGFLRSVLRAAPEYRVVFILDEFDELPVDIYKRGPIGDAFFLTLRSISAKPSFGFVLVGGEKMEFILSTQGDALNKFQPLRVDYFDREKHWADFQDLIRRPTRWWLEISDEALVGLYEESAGNPFFAKLICNELFRLVLKRRDAYVSRAEVREAIRRTLVNTGSNRFQHFWEDGIFQGSGEQVEERSILRRHVLLALADLMRRNGPRTRHEIIAAAKRNSVLEHDAEAELTAFERRQVLIRENDVYTCKVALFGEWLQDRGVQEIVTTFTDREAMLKRREVEERVRVSERELQDLVESWGIYKGRAVGPEAVRAWLGQFGGVADQRLMFNLLKNIRFYRSDTVRAKMREAHGIVERHMAERRMVHRIEAGQRKRRDILVSHLGGVAKSGVRYGQLYADENGLVSESVVEFDRIGRSLETRPDARALVFVDDFLGTGESAISAFKELNRSFGDGLRSRDIVLFYAVACGFESGRTRLETELSRLGLPVAIQLCDPMVESDKAFADTGSIFLEPHERELAKNLATSYGSRLVKNAPLGHGDCQALVVFEANCPNNTLPILWADKADWKALFPRL